MRQTELTPAAAAPVDTEDRFAEYRRLYPGAKFIEFHDQRTGNSFVVQAPPGSAWHEMLPEGQVAEIRPKP